MDSIYQEVMNTGELVEISGNRPILLSDKGYLYFVLEGSVDLFLLDTYRDDRGRRHYLFSLEAGQVFTSINILDDKRPTEELSAEEKIAQEQSTLEQSTKDQSTLDQFAQEQSIKGHSAQEYSAALLATALPETRVYRIGFRDFMESIVNYSQFINTLDNWVKTFYGEINDYIERKCLNDFYHKWEEWISADSVDALYETLNVNLNLLIEQNKIVNFISDFNVLCLTAAVGKRNHYQEKERILFREKLKKDEEIVNQSFHEIIGSYSRKDSSYLYYSGNKLFASCQKVAEYLKVELKLPDKSGDLNLDEIAEASQIRYRTVFLEGDWWQEDVGPLLAFMENEQEELDKDTGRAVALIPTSPSSYKIFDPVTMKEEKFTAETAERIKPEALSFYRPFPDRSLGIKDLITFFTEDFWKRDIFLMILAGLMVGILGLTIPLATGIIFNYVIPTAAVEQIWQIAFILLAAVGARALFELARSFSFARIRSKFDYSIQSAVWDRLLRLPISFFRDYTAGELAKKALSVMQLREMFSDLIISSLLGGVFSFFFYIQMYYFSRSLTKGATALILIAALITILLGFIRSKYYNNLIVTQNKMSGFLLQMISGISKIRVSAAENRFFKQWSEGFSQQRKLTFKVQVFNNYLKTINAVFPAIITIILYYMMSSRGTQLSTGYFIAFMAAFASFQTAIIAFSESLIQLFSIGSIWKNLKPILGTIPEYDGNKKDIGEIKGDIEVSNLAFRYNDESPMVLKELSLNIKAGEYVALVGPSGSGKSTLLRLLLGFEKPLNGRIYYDQQDIEKIDIRSIRKQLGIVLQDGKLITGSILDNIIGTNLNLTEDDAWEAARAAGIAEDIRKMPMGMQTVISQGQQTLSGGQKQRILIARAIVNKPKIIYFDEATSALDNRTQKQVIDSLEGLNITRVVVAHRLSTIKNCDRIFVIDNGRVVEEGNYQQLIKQEGIFGELAERQLA